MHRLLLTIIILSAACAPASEYRIWTKRPASEWSKGYPIGNGSLGAVITGHPHRDIIQFNENTLWSGYPHDYARPQASKHLTALRKYILDGYIDAAEKKAQESFMGNPGNPMSYLPFGDLQLDFADHSKYSDYSMELDLDSATVTVRYRIGKTTYKREIFASHADQSIVIRLTANTKKSISFAASFRTPHKIHNVMRTANGELSLQGIPENGAVEFEARLACRNEGGTSLLSDNELQITKADSVTLFLTAATSFKNFNDLSAVPTDICTSRLAALSEKSIEAIRNAHLTDYRLLFSRMSINLGRDRSADQPTADRLINYKRHSDTHLAAIYLQFARYLLIAGSRRGTQPLTSMGIWNNSMNPEQGCRYKTDINLQMNYWPAESLNLAECTYPLLDMILELAITGQSTAKEHYNCRGWVAHHNSDIWRAAAPSGSAGNGLWVTGGAWLSRHLWIHYLHTGDRTFLKNTAYPIMKSSATFFLDFLFKVPGSSTLISIPSSSPTSAGLSAGPTMDHQIIRDLFSNCIHASMILDSDPSFRRQLIEEGRKIAANQIDKNGLIIECIKGKPSVPDSPYLSPAWGIYPGTEISETLKPEIYGGIEKWLTTKKNASEPWSSAWMMCIRARTGNAEKAYDRLTDIIATRTGPNLLQKKNPFHVDLNMGAATGIFEMLLQSHSGDIVLLPALPSQWPDGSVSGLRAQGGFTVNIQWANGALKTAELISHAGNKCRLKYKDFYIDLKTKPGKSYKWRPKTGSSTQE